MLSTCLQIFSEQTVESMREIDRESDEIYVNIYGQIVLKHEIHATRFTMKTTLACLICLYSQLQDCKIIRFNFNNYPFILTKKEGNIQLLK